MKTKILSSFPKFAGTLLVTVLIQAFGATSLTPVAHAQEGDYKERMKELRAERKEKREQIADLRLELVEAKKALANQKLGAETTPVDLANGCEACATACPIPADLKDEEPKNLCLKFDSMKADILKALVERAARDGKPGADRAACDAAVNACTAVVQKRNIAAAEAKVKDLETQIAELSREKEDVKFDIKVTRATKGCESCREAMYERRELSLDLDSDFGPIASYGGGAAYGYSRPNGAAQIIGASTPLLLGGLSMGMYGRQVNAWENSMGNYYQTCAMQGIPCQSPGMMPGMGGFGGGFGGLYGGLGGMGFGSPFGGGLGGGIGLNLGLGLGTGFGNGFGNGLYPGAYGPYGLGTGLGVGIGNPYGMYGMNPFGGGLGGGIGLNLGLGLGTGFGNGFGNPYGMYGMDPFGGGLNGGLGLGLGLGGGFNPYAMNGMGGYPNQMYMIQMQQQQQYMMQLQQQQMYQAQMRAQAVMQYQMQQQQLAQALMISQQQVAQSYARYSQVAQMYQMNQYQGQALLGYGGFGGGAGFGVNAGIGFNLGIGTSFGTSFGGRQPRSVEEMIRMQGGSGLPTQLPSLESNDFLTSGI